MTTRESIRDEELLLREKLAAERTHLANERTLLAYARTGLAFLVAGVTGEQLLDQGIWRVVALSFIVLGPAISVFGIWRFVRFRREIH